MRASADGANLEDRADIELDDVLSSLVIRKCNPKRLKAECRFSPN